MEHGNAELVLFPINLLHKHPTVGRQQIFPSFVSRWRQILVHIILVEGDLCFRVEGADLVLNLLEKDDPAQQHGAIKKNRNDGNDGDTRGIRPSLNNLFILQRRVLFIPPLRMSMVAQASKIRFLTDIHVQPKEGRSFQVSDRKE